MKTSIERIESMDFCAFVNVVSSLSGFLSVIQAERAVQTLILNMRLENEWVDVLGRIQCLLGLSIDQECKNPNDVALATYIFSLFLFEHWAGQLAAEWAVTAKNTWWTQRVSELIRGDD